MAQSKQKKRPAKKKLNARAGIFFYEDLSDDAQVVAREWYSELLHSLWDSNDSEDISQAIEYAAELHYRVKTTDTCWSLNYCQGDGVAFYGSLDIDFLTADREEEKAPEGGWKGEEDRLRIVRLFHLLRDSFCEVSVHIDGSSSRYHHWNSMDVRVGVIDSLSHRERHCFAKEFHQDLQVSSRSCFDYQQMAHALLKAAEVEDDSTVLVCLDFFEERGVEVDKVRLAFRPDEPWNRIVETLRDALQQYMKDVSRYAEHCGYGEIEYRYSDEAIADSIKANDYEFNEDGSKYERCRRE